MVKISVSFREGESSGPGRISGYNFVTVQAGGGLVEALRYKPEGRKFDSRWCHWNFSLT